jgi:hypothetical protein
MSVGPRVLFTRFVNGDSPKLQPWLDHLRRVVPLTDRPPTLAVDLMDSAVVWQLISGNNRQLGRSARIHSSYKRAADDARSAIESVHALDLVEVSEQFRGTYGWYATAAGDPIITCSRWYSTERDRQNAFALAMLSLSAAEMLGGARLMDPALMASDGPRA